LVRRVLTLPVGLVFAFTGLVKLLHPSAFANQVERFATTPAGAGIPLAYLLGIVELALAAGLISGAFFPWVRRLGMALLLLFMALLLASMFSTVQVECPCYGPLLQLNPAMMILHDSLLFLMLLMAGPKNLPQNKPKLALAAVSLPLIVLVLWGRSSALFDPLVLRLRPGYAMPSLPSLHERSTNKDAKRLVVVAATTPDRQQMQNLALAYPTYEPILLRMPEGDAQAGPEWLVMPLKPSLATHLVRHLPSAFLVEEDQVRSVWYGRLPDGD
jgi:uncharacterized membrane protein YphA (DoxX/SURF4 family)